MSDKPVSWMNSVHHTAPSVMECYDGPLSDSETHSLLTLSNVGAGLVLNHVTLTHHGDHVTLSENTPSYSRQRQPSWISCIRYSTCRQNIKCPYVTCTSFRNKPFSALILSTVVFVLLSLLYMGGHVGSGFQFGQFSWRGLSDMEQRLPQVIIVGVRKCGTRALLEFLSLHPDICHAHDEMHFFDKNERYSLGLEWYRKQMPLSHPHQLTMEKTPGYFIARHVPSLIQNMNGSIKLLIIIRDPVTRIISDYTQAYANHMKRNMTYTPFEDLVIDTQTGEISNFYKPAWISLYYLHYMHWLSVFNHSQIHLIDGDSLVENPMPELGKIETFLGLRHHLSEEHFYFNKTRGFYCIKKDIESRCLNPSKGRAHPIIKPRVLHKLYKFFKPLNEKFYKLSGQFFDWSEAKRRKKKQ